MYKRIGRINVQQGSASSSLRNVSVCRVNHERAVSIRFRLNVNSYFGTRAFYRMQGTTANKMLLGEKYYCQYAKSFHEIKKGGCFKDFGYSHYSVKHFTTIYLLCNICILNSLNF